MGLVGNRLVRVPSRVLLSARNVPLRLAASLFGNAVMGHGR